MRSIFHRTRQFMADELGLAAVAYAGSSSMTTAMIAVAVDIVMQGRRALSVNLPGIAG
ncbi:MAG: hypothetical protein KGQ75_08360 [Sphingomonadales bacterium]|nr:hypothetical protein [Novosphingobium sp. NDB2Meth1]MBU6394571.1 hypothetical protein [Sphingomonadales bacterium]